MTVHPKVELVLYPGRADHPDKALADQVLKNGFGNMVSFRIRGGRAEAVVYIDVTPVNDAPVVRQRQSYRFDPLRRHRNGGCG